MMGIHALFFALLLLHGSAHGMQQPSTANAPLLVGTIRLSQVPSFNASDAPTRLAPTRSYQRRLDNYPAASDLSQSALERLWKPQPATNSSNSTPAAAGRHLLAADHQRAHISMQQRPNRPAGYPTGQHHRPQRTALHPAAAHTPQQLAAGAHNQPGAADAPSQGRQLLATPLVTPKGPFSPWQATQGGPSLAASPNHLVLVQDAAMTVSTLIPGLNTVTAPAQTLLLEDLFASVGSSNCKEGVWDGQALWDTSAKRFVISAACGGQGVVLLAASASADPFGSWFLFVLVADGVNTGAACRTPQEAAVADWPRLSYDANGIYVSLFAYCPSAPWVQGAVLLALPKQKVYKGAPNFVYAVFTSDQILAALPKAAQQGIAPANIRQCQPALPQQGSDVQGGIVVFVCEHQATSAGDAAVPQTLSSFLLVTLIQTGALWQYSTRPDSPTPFLLATPVRRAQPVARLPSAALPSLQTEGASPAAGARSAVPSGFWQGAVAVSQGTLYVVDRHDVSGTPPGSVTPQAWPTLVWSQYRLSLSQTKGPGTTCTNTADWGSRWDWSRDWSLTWGQDFDRNYEQNQAAVAELKAALQELDAQQQQQQQQQQEQQSGSEPSPAPSEEAAGTPSPVPSTPDTPAAAATAAPAAAAGVAVASGSSPQLPAAAPVKAAVAQQQRLAFRPTGTASHQTAAISSSSRSPTSRSNTVSVKGAQQGGRGRSDMSVEERIAFLLQSMGAYPYIPPPTTTSGRTQSAALAATSSSGKSNGTASNGRHLNQLVNNFAWLPSCWYCFNPQSTNVGVGSSVAPNIWYYTGWTGPAWDMGFGMMYGGGRPWFYGRLVPFLSNFWGRRHLLQANSAEGGSEWADLDLIPSSRMNVEIPPCLRQGVSYNNTCQSCNYNGYSASINASAVLRQGQILINEPWQQPLGMFAPSLAVSPDGTLHVLFAYQGSRPLVPFRQEIPQGVTGLAVAKVSRGSTTANIQLLQSSSDLTPTQQAAPWTLRSSIQVQPNVGRLMYAGMVPLPSPPPPPPAVITPATSPTPAASVILAAAGGGPASGDLTASGGAGRRLAQADVAGGADVAAVSAPGPTLVGPASVFALDAWGSPQHRLDMWLPGPTNLASAWGSYLG